MTQQFALWVTSPEGVATVLQFVHWVRPSPVVDIPPMETLPDPPEGQSPPKKRTTYTRQDVSVLVFLSSEDELAPHQCVQAHSQ